MPLTTYVCIDTNILVRIITQGQPGCEIDLWEEFKKQVQNKAVTLLVPEVITLELQKQLKTQIDDHESEYRNLSDSVGAHLEGAFTGKNKIWNEIADTKDFIKQQLSNKLKSKLEEVRSRLEEIPTFLKSSNATLLPYTLEIHFEAHRRILSGNVAKKEGRPIEDCAIIETLAKYFGSEFTNRQLIICTENLQDFGVELEEGKKTALHPAFRDALPPTEIVKSLKELSEFLAKKKAVETPDVEVVEKAIERERDKASDRMIDDAALRRWMDLVDLSASSTIEDDSDDIFRGIFPQLTPELSRMGVRLYIRKQSDFISNMTNKVRSALFILGLVDAQLKAHSNNDKSRQTNELKASIVAPFLTSLLEFGINETLLEQLQSQYHQQLHHCNLVAPTRTMLELVADQNKLISGVKEVLKLKNTLGIRF